MYETVSAEKQKRALQFLNREVFRTPKWLIDYKLSNLSGTDLPEQIGKIQQNTLDRLLSIRTLSHLVSAEAQNSKQAYSIRDFLQTLKTGIWYELDNHAAIDVYRRNLQKHYVQTWINLLNPPPKGSRDPDPTQTDASGIARGQLMELQAALKSALPATTDLLSKYHLQDLSERIKLALHP